MADRIIWFKPFSVSDEYDVNTYVGEQVDGEGNVLDTDVRLYTTEIWQLGVVHQVRVKAPKLAVEYLLAIRVV